MANFSWKSLSLLVVTLLVALALQAGAVKIMINLTRQTSPPVAAETRATPIKPTPSALAALEAERQQFTDPKPQEPGNPALPIREPLPETTPSDPPHLAGLPENPESSQHQLATETSQPAVATPPATSTTAPQPNAVPAVPPNHPSPSAAPPTATAPAAAEVHSDAHSAAPPTATETGASPSATTAPVEAVTGLQEASWLKTRDAKHYTVQLYSGKDLGKLKEIAGTTAATAPQAYYTTTSRSGPWYSLVAGDYPDSASAQAAAAKITAQAPTMKPWVRRFDELQAKLR